MTAATPLFVHLAVHPVHAPIDSLTRSAPSYAHHEQATYISRDTYDEPINSSTRGSQDLNGSLHKMVR
jgi:hypothetical protein